MGTQDVNEDTAEMMRLLEIGRRELSGLDTDELDLHRAGFTAAEIIARDSERRP